MHYMGILKKVIKTHRKYTELSCTKDFFDCDFFYIPNFGNVETLQEFRDGKYNCSLHVFGGTPYYFPILEIIFKNRKKNPQRVSKSKKALAIQCVKEMRYGKKSEQLELQGIFSKKV